MSRREASRSSREDVKEGGRGEERTGSRSRLNQRKDKLTLPEVPGYHRHWINDDNVPDMLDRGYRFLEEDFMIGEKVVSVGEKTGSCLTLDVGGGITAYAMILKDEYRAEDDVDRRVNVNAQSREALDKLEDDSFYGEVKNT